MRRQEEFEHSKYYFEIADVNRVRKMYDLYRAEAEACLAHGLVVPAHDYVLKCSHAFNMLDTRGAIGVTERQAFFGQMRELARRVAEAYLEQRKALEYPLRKDQAPEKAQQQPLPTSVTETSDFVLEIGVEELPAGDVSWAVEQISLLFKSQILDTYRLKYDSLRVFGTPRRLAVYVNRLAPQGETTFIEVKGPPESAAFDKEGKPTQALLGWIKKNDLAVPDEFLTKDYLVQERNGGRYVIQQKEAEGSTITVLFPRVLPAFMHDIKFDKTMRWNDSGIAFSRPIRWLVALFGGTIIPFEYAGVSSGRVTRGLRPYDSPEIEIRAADQYLEAMQRAEILLGQEERRASIVEQVNRVAESVGGQVMFDGDPAHHKSALLDEVANLVEKPTALLGNFDSEYLQLPRDVLVSTMKKHQRYFPIEKSGKLSPNFIAIRNGDNQHLDVVQQGNEHVLAARFADAAFFVREDLKHKLEEFRPKLATLIFQKQLGSMLDKSERMLKLSAELAKMLQLDETQRADVQRATFLAKADLVTQMVTEMTSLQGIIGREYAARSGERAAAAEAIGEQYQPVPKTKIGLVVALADRLDSLVGLFAAGLAPTGAKDPFGLRRAALGVVQPLIEHDLDFDLAGAVKKSAKLQPIAASAEIQTKVLDFIAGRLSVVLKDSGYKYDVVEAILSEQANNPAGSLRAVKQLTQWVERKDWHEILPAFARCVRITRDQKKTFKVDEKAFVEREEQRLYAALQKAESSAAGGPASVDGFLSAFVPLIPAINAFFDKVLVMAEEKAVRENRLALLQRISALAEWVVNLSKLEGF